MSHFRFNPECPHLPFVTPVILQARVRYILSSFYDEPLPTSAPISICAQVQVHQQFTYSRHLIILMSAE